MCRVVDEVRERGTEYVVTKHGRPVAVVRPWGEEDVVEARRVAVAAILEKLEAGADRVAAAAGGRSAVRAVTSQRR